MKNIYLIGFMGCGKSAVSAYMASNYGMQIVEMDEQIVEQEGISIPEIFEIKGEAYFREAETQLLEQLQRETNRIVSCGGGAILKQENIEIMRKSGTIILLTATPETIFERVKDDDNRPLLKGHKNVEYIRELLEKRRPRYEAAADMIVATDERNVGAICEEILEKIK